VPLGGCHPKNTQTNALLICWLNNTEILGNVGYAGAYLGLGGLGSCLGR